jgi:glyoxylase-like metal-dependent hydrolase (beta-lactamase superfamily II)
MKRRLAQTRFQISFVALIIAIPALILLSSSAAQQQFGPAGVAPDASWTPVKSIDFSSKHNVMIKSEDGTLTPMDVPYFKSELIAPGTWRILSDGDYAYLIEGDNEALAIDSTYGAGNIREYMQTLTKKPVRYVANTHDHFDHTANNSYFDRAYMSAFTKTLATIPFASFSGINFPRNYPIQVVGDGYAFHLGNRDVEVFEIPNHTMGDLAYLDKRSRILFSGDVFIPITINSQSTVARFAANMRKLETHRSEFDKLAGGTYLSDASVVDHYLANAEYILAGHEGEPISAQQRGGPGGPPGGPQNAQTAQADVPPGTIVYIRHRVRPGDGGAGRPGGAPNPNIRRMTYSDCSITYDITKIN